MAEISVEKNWTSSSSLKTMQEAIALLSRDSASK
jgi:hypothetical protein